MYPEDNLSPSLFKIFLNDIVDHFDPTCDPIQLGDAHLNCLLYADDISLMSNSPTGLQNCLNTTYNYCKHVVNPKLRQSLARLRVNCHKLLIEIGRYCIPKIPAEERLCKCCNLQRVEDEMHLVSVCPFHKQNRETLYDIAVKECKVFSSLSNRNKFLVNQ